jgi:hypothetical protein
MLEAGVLEAGVPEAGALAAVSRAQPDSSGRPERIGHPPPSAHGIETRGGRSQMATSARGIALEAGQLGGAPSAASEQRTRVSSGTRSDPTGHQRTIGAEAPSAASIKGAATQRKVRMVDIMRGSSAREAHQVFAPCQEALGW